MYISEIRIDGFTSYKTRTHVEDLSPNVNVVVGRNGAGKSNFFAAVRFVFGDLANSNISDLIHNGRGARADVTTVEVTLADIGSRFPNYDEKITFARVLTPSSDRYLLNDKYVPKTTVRALLDSAGLSLGGNAFFIVPQGDVTRLAAASDEQRLKTMLFASGAQTFEDRKQAALKNLEQSQTQMAEASELMDRMQEHLQRVSEEATNLQQHLELRKEIRGIEYLLLNVEKTRTQIVISAEDDKLTEQRQRLTSIASQLAEREAELGAQRQAVADFDDELADLTAELDAAKRQVQITSEHQRTITNMTQQQDGGLESLSLTFSRNPSSAVAEDEMEVDDEFADQVLEEEDVNRITARHAQVRSDLDAQTKKLAAITARLRALQLKQGRANQLDSREVAVKREQSVANARNVIAEIERTLETEAERHQNFTAKLEAAHTKLRQAELEARTAGEDHMDALAANKEAQQQASQAESTRNQALLSLRRAAITSDRLEKSAEQLSKQLLLGSSAPIVRGVRQVRDVVASLGLGPSKYFGTVADIVEVQPAVEYAVDRVAGSVWFHHVVDSAETLETIVKGLQQAAPGLSGSATFIPLADVLVPESPTVPDNDHGSYLKDMLSVRDARFQKIVQLLFGKYYLCRDPRSALQYARNYGVVGVTVEGDICHPKGSLSGGSSSTVDSTGKRLSLVRRLGHVCEQLVQCRVDKTEQRNNADQAAQAVTQRLDIAGQTRVMLMEASQKYQTALNPVNEAEAEVARLSQRLNDSLTYAEEQKADLKAAEEELRALTSEEFAQKLTAEEEAELRNLQTDMWSVEKSCKTLAVTEYDLGDRSHRIARAFERQQAAVSKVQRVAEEEHVSEEQRRAAEEAREANQAARGEVFKLQQKLDEIESTAATKHEQLRQLEESARQIESEMKAIYRKVENHSIKMQAFKNLVKEIDDKMSQMPSIPSTALNEAQEYGPNNDLKALARDLSSQQSVLTARLQSLGDVNMRSINDYERYSQELETLTTQYDGLETECDVIRQTISSLDAQKQGKLDSMLSKVVGKFEEIFSVITGGERGTLLLNRKENGELESIGLDVSFGSSSQQFSGGQKCLCALALIFAAQTCDPAPFYIFDEIDANLDEGARGRVAALIHKLSHRSEIQFICTTFREELVKIADAQFDVTFEYQESRMNHITREQALDFVTEGIASSS